MIDRAVTWILYRLHMYREPIPVPEGMRLLAEGEVREWDEYTVGPKCYKIAGVRLPARLGDAIVRAYRRRHP